MLDGKTATGKTAITLTGLETVPKRSQSLIRTTAYVQLTKRCIYTQWRLNSDKQETDLVHKLKQLQCLGAGPPVYTLPNTDLNNAWRSHTNATEFDDNQPLLKVWRMKNLFQ